MEASLSKKYKIYIALVSVFVLVQPILDIYKCLAPKKIEFFGISIIEIINLALTGSLVLITIFLNCQKKLNTKRLWLIFSISAIYIFYLLAHIYSILTFNKSIFPNNAINAFTELYYIFRAFIEPLILLGCLYINKFPSKTFYKLITVLTIFVSGLIVVSNLFGFSLVAYSVENKKILSNIFSWVNFTASYTKPLTSKGLFFSANQLSNLFVILLPINIYSLIKNTKIQNIAAVILQMLSMIMLGTRTATYGQIVICFASIALTVIISIVNKENLKKYIKKYFILYLIAIMFIPVTYYGPLYLEKRNSVDKTEIIDNNEKEDIVIIDEGDNDILVSKSLKDIDCTKISFDNRKSLIEYLYNNYSDYHISKYYIEVYDIKEDPIFWCKIYQENYDSSGNSRLLKTKIFDHIYDQSGRDIDKYYGLWYTLKMLTLETDYNEIFYQFGIFGLLLFIGPYVLLFIMSFFTILLNLKEKFTYENIFLLASVFCGLVSPHLSGHMFSNLFVTIPFTLIIAMLSLAVNGRLGEK